MRAGGFRFRFGGYVLTRIKHCRCCGAGVITEYKTRARIYCDACRVLKGRKWIAPRPCLWCHTMLPRGTVGQYCDRTCEGRDRRVAKGHSYPNVACPRCGEATYMLEAYDRGICITCGYHGDDSRSAVVYAPYYKSRRLRETLVAAGHRVSDGRAENGGHRENV